MTYEFYIKKGDTFVKAPKEEYKLFQGRKFIKYAQKKGDKKIIYEFYIEKEFGFSKALKEEYKLFEGKKFIKHTQNKGETKEKQMNKTERMGFLTERMRDSLHFKSLATPNGKYRFDNAQELYYSENGFKDISTLSIDKLLDYDLFLIPLNHSFTDDELVIMKNMPYKWLVRSESGHIRNYEKEPIKYADEKGRFYTGLELCVSWLDHLFPTIQFENKQPIKISDYTKEEGENK